MAVNWDDIEESYAALIEARSEGQTSTMMRLTELQLSLDEALTAHVTECVVQDHWSWQKVADAIGVTRQAASKRWRLKVFPLS